MALAVTALLAAAGWYVIYPDSPPECTDQFAERHAQRPPQDADVDPAEPDRSLDRTAPEMLADARLLFEVWVDQTSGPGRPLEERGDEQLARLPLVLEHLLTELRLGGADSDTGLQPEERQQVEAMVDAMVRGGAFADRPATEREVERWAEDQIRYELSPARKGGLRAALEEPIRDRLEDASRRVQIAIDARMRAGHALREFYGWEVGSTETGDGSVGDWVEQIALIVNWRADGAQGDDPVAAKIKGTPWSPVPDVSLVRADGTPDTLSQGQAVDRVQRIIDDMLPRHKRHLWGDRSPEGMKKGRKLLAQDSEAVLQLAGQVLGALVGQLPDPEASEIQISDNDDAILERLRLFAAHRTGWRGLEPSTDPLTPWREGSRIHEIARILLPSQLPPRGTRVLNFSTWAESLEELAGHPAWELDFERQDSAAVTLELALSIGETVLKGFGSEPSPETGSAGELSTLTDDLQKLGKEHQEDLADQHWLRLTSSPKLRESIEDGAFGPGFDRALIRRMFEAAAHLVLLNKGADRQPGMSTGTGGER